MFFDVIIIILCVSVDRYLMRTQFDKSILITYVSTLVSLCVSNYGKCKHLAIGVCTGSVVV